MDITLLLPLGLAVPAVWAALEDIQSLTIRNRFSLAIIALWPVALIAGLGPETVVGIGVSIMAALLVLMLGFAGFALGIVGGGDGKLMAAVALWAGPALLGPQLIATLLAGGVLALIMMLVHSWKGSRLATITGVDLGGSKPLTLPYGPAIAVGALVVAGGMMSQSLAV